MKKLSFIILFAASCITAGAQEIMTVADSNVYMFNPRSEEKDLLLGGAPDYIPSALVVQRYVPTDTVTVYGVAITFYNRYYGGDLFDSVNAHYTAVLMERTPGTHDSLFNGYLVGRPMHYVDSLPLDSSNMRYCLFRYDYDLPSPGSYLSPCHEFYFNTPKKINRMADTFYVGRNDHMMANYTFFPFNVCVRNTNSANGSEFFITQPPIRDTDFFHPEYTGNSWGFAFPIIGFRCKPLDEESHSLLLTGEDGHGATVTWYSVEDGATYNVRLTAIDGSWDTVVVTDDSSHVFSHLPAGKRLLVQVRKQCHYATVNYDTIVYSPWTQSRILFETDPDDTGGEGGGEGGGDGSGVDAAALEGEVELSPNPARGEVTVSSGYGLTGIELHDAAGVKVYGAPADGHRAVVPLEGLRPGTYVVTVHTRAGTARKKLVRL